jgi:hypothetical protein
VRATGIKKFLAAKPRIIGYDALFRTTVSRLTGAVMPSSASNQANRWIGWVLRVIGLGIFVLAFFLPAVSAGGTGAAATVFPGWKCASIALSEMAGLFNKTEPPSLVVLLAVFSGWINPLIVLVILSSFFSKLRVVRRVMGVLIVLCMAATWLFFVKQKVEPLIGHWLWIAGALLILAPDAMPGRKTAIES